MGKYLERLKRLEQEAPKSSKDWLSAWRDLATCTYGIREEDHRFESVMRWLNACDVAFSLGSWSTFSEAAAMVKEMVKRQPNQPGGPPK
jgi:hypothetical protein